MFLSVMALIRSYIIHVTCSKVIQRVPPGFGQSYIPVLKDGVKVFFFLKDSHGNKGLFSIIVLNLNTLLIKLKM